jgi:hypothetical protein
VQPGDPRADPTVVDLIELAGLWVAAEDWSALARTLGRLDAEFASRFPHDAALRQRFGDLLALVESQRPSADEIRRRYRRAAVG